jgi:hypothetical protein
MIKMQIRLGYGDPRIRLVTDNIQDWSGRFSAISKKKELTI